jgi:drug/metabolite transporter (DMT)-like permease
VSPVLRRLLADLALVGVAVVWGATFPVAKRILEFLPPFAYLAVRFAVATVALLPLARFARRAGPSWAWRRGAAAGLALGAGYALQTLALRSAPATSAAFITGLFVVLVPVLGLMWGRRPGAWEWTGVVVGTAGLVLLTGGASRFGVAEALLVGCAASFALHILILDQAAPHLSPAALGALQVGVAAAVCAAFVPFESIQGPVPAEVWAAVAGMGLVASAVAFSVQAWAQRFTPPTHVGLVFAGEPVAAAVFARLWLGERLDALQWAGAALILAGITAAQLGAPEPAAQRGP